MTFCFFKHLIEGSSGASSLSKNNELDETEIKTVEDLLNVS